jgi:hypothetical protein
VTSELLRQRFEHYGNGGLLVEVITLGRETLTFFPKQHRYRGLSCGNLTNSLKIRYERTGEVDPLDEIIDQQRKMLGLCPVGHTYRSMFCGNLVISLTTRYERTSDVGLGREAQLPRGLDQFRAEHLLHWIEALSLTVSLHDVQRTMRDLIAVLNVCVILRTHVSGVN